MRAFSRCMCTMLMLTLIALALDRRGFEVSASRAADPIQRFLSRTPEHLTSYRALRTLRASNKRFKKEGWLTAWTELDPRGGFRYEIVSEGGSDYIRRRVLLKMLDGERDAIAAGQPGRVALSPANYRFSVMSEDDRVARLQIVPLRADTLLVNGTVTIEAGTGDLLSVEGRLAKNPSFWTNRVDVSRRYGRVAGIRVPLQVDSTASVKFAGTSEFSMTYEYASINGLSVGEPLPSRVSEIRRGLKREVHRQISCNVRETRARRERQMERREEFGELDGSHCGCSHGEASKETS